MLPELNLQGAARSVIILCRALCSAPASKSAFFYNPNTSYSNSDIIYLSTRGPPARFWRSQRNVLPRLHERAWSRGGRWRVGGVEGRAVERRGGWRVSLANTHDAVWAGRACRLADFSSVSFLCPNGRAVINQMSGSDRHATGRVQDLLFGSVPGQVCSSGSFLTGRESSLQWSSSYLNRNKASTCSIIQKYTIQKSQRKRLCLRKLE